jgi:hypothetical protein
MQQHEPGLLSAEGGTHENLRSGDSTLGESASGLLGLGSARLGEWYIPAMRGHFAMA